MKQFTVPARDEVSADNQAIFDNLQKAIGMVPNLYASFAKSETALANYMALQNSKTSLSTKEREVVNLVVSQTNNCRYCLSAHTMMGKMNGFTDDQILEIRTGSASFNPKLDALVHVAKSIAVNKGHIADNLLTAFYEAGYTEGSLIDVIIAVGDKIISNYLHAATDIPIDFPLAPALSAVEG